jgi:hypothetical protein
LTADPPYVDFGRVTAALGTVSASVTITNASAEDLIGRRYVFLGDVNQPAGFRVEPNLSTCIDSGGSLSGTTVGLRNHTSCTFNVQFDPTQLPEDTYLGRLNVTIGGNTIRVLAFAEVVRNVGAGSLCVGDCAGINSVSVSNLVMLVNIALGTADTSACQEGIPAGRQVNIAVLMQAVTNLWNGCGTG